MATPNTKTFAQLVSDQVAAIQGAARSLVDLTVGSILLAVVQANAAVQLWLQGLILLLLATTRASTSTGSDLDTFVGDFGLTREPAVAAIGTVTFTRFTASQQASLPVGATVQTADGTQKFVVVADPENGAYNSGDNTYVLPVNTASLDVPVQAATAGIGGNAQAGQINTITQALPGIDTVNNAQSFTSGKDAEGDAALRLRFIAFIASLSKGTKGAIDYAITSLQVGVTDTLVENETYEGVGKDGYFYAVVDDGTGMPSDEFISTANNAIDAVRPFTSTFGVFKPVLVNADVTMVITTGPGYTHADEVAMVVAALSTFIGTLPRDKETQVQTMPYSRLSQIAYDTSPGVTNVTGILLNGGTDDLTADAKHKIQPHTLDVT
jgi:uncharacterized phage protein gp47/JayE